MELTGKTALVTGGCGLIGSTIVDQLLQKGCQVRILDNLEPCTHLEGKPPWVPQEAQLIVGDMRNIQDVEKAVSGVDVIFHQAAYGGFAPELTKMTDVNACGTSRIFEVIRTKGLNVQKIVTASSQAVYGEGRYRCEQCGPCSPEPRAIAQLERGEWEVKCPTCGKPTHGMPINEEAPLKLTGVYALSKYFEERLTLALGREWGIPTVALRYSLTYGPRQSIFNPYSGICSIFSTRLLNGLPPVIYEDGRQTRDFVYVGDVARANVMVMEQDAATGKVFNVGTGRGTSVMEFACLLRDAYGVKVDPVTPGEYRPVDFRHLIADNSKITALGWSPTVSVAEGVRHYAGWILAMERPAEYFTKAEQMLKQLRIVRKLNQ
ncbi:MAG TPA: SDR family NAD(P)-dependent oxidoreductase [Verrucomicrobiae bacterium]|nr:SDR family NAD(P)-dependent oxidoreductase [Verrucomicrobiae bacterium]